MSSSPCVQIWKVDEAPQSLRSLNTGQSNPEWIALVPGELSEINLNDLIVANVGAANVSRYTMKNGDVVYIGGRTASNRLTSARGRHGRLPAKSAA